MGHVDEIRGDCPVAFVILRGSSNDHLTEADKAKLFREINEKVRHDVGPIARLEAVLIVNKLPKTRSGKILRGTIRKIINDEEFKMPATIDDVSTLDNIKEITREWLDKKKAAQ